PANPQTAANLAVRRIAFPFIASIRSNLLESRLFRTRRHGTKVPRSHLIPHGTETTEERGPVFQMRREDTFDYFLCPLRNKYIQLIRADANFITHFSPIQQVRFP